MMCLGVGLFGFILIGTLCASCSWPGFPPLRVSKVFCHYFFKQVFYPLLLFFLFWDCYDSNLLRFTLSWSSLKLSSYFLSLFFVQLVYVIFLSTLSFSLVIQSSASCRLIVIPSGVFFYYRYCILHLFLGFFFFSFYFLFHSVIVHSQFLLVVGEFFEYPYNHSFEFCIWLFACRHFI